MLHDFLNLAVGSLGVVGGLPNKPGVIWLFLLLRTSHVIALPGSVTEYAAFFFIGVSVVILSFTCNNAVYHYGRLFLFNIATSELSSWRGPD